MGTVFTFDVRDPEPRPERIDDAINWLRHVDSIFSTYRVDSQISQLNRGERTVADCAPEIVEALGLCADMERETDGYFSSRWNGTIDPTGLVKGWSVERVSTMLSSAGMSDHAVNGGGDIRVVGGNGPWHIGITDPARRGDCITTIVATDLAIATSGTAERGAHVVDPYTRRPATSFSSVTVVGPDLTVADAFATAAMAMGESALAWLTARPRYEAFFVDNVGGCYGTPGFGRYIDRPVGRPTE